MDTWFVVAMLLGMAFCAVVVMFTIQSQNWNSVIKEMAEKLEEEQQHSSKLWHQLDDAYAAKEELRNEHLAALRRGDEYKNASAKRILTLQKELKDTEFLTETYYKELQNAKELLKVVEWAAKTEVIAAKPRIIKAVPPTVQPQLATLLAAASISPELKRMLGL